MGNWASNAPAQNASDDDAVFGASDALTGTTAAETAAAVAVVPTHDETLDTGTLDEARLTAAYPFLEPAHIATVVEMAQLLRRAPLALTWGNRVVRGPLTGYVNFDTLKVEAFLMSMASLLEEVQFMWPAECYLNLDFELCAAKTGPRGAHDDKTNTPTMRPHLVYEVVCRRPDSLAMAIRRDNGAVPDFGAIYPWMTPDQCERMREIDAVHDDIPRAWITCPHVRGVWESLPVCPTVDEDTLRWTCREMRKHTVLPPGVTSEGELLSYVLIRPMVRDGQIHVESRFASRHRCFVALPGRQSLVDLEALYWFLSPRHMAAVGRIDACLVRVPHVWVDASFHLDWIPDSQGIPLCADTRNDLDIACAKCDPDERTAAMARISTRTLTTILGVRECAAGPLLLVTHAYDRID